MDALSGAGGGFPWWRRHNSSPQNNRRRQNNNSNSSSNSVDSAGGGGVGFRFPLKQALTAGSLAVAGDTIAQVRVQLKGMEKKEEETAIDSGDGDKAAIFTRTIRPRGEINKNQLILVDVIGKRQVDLGILGSLVSRHDWVRALRMASYGFLLYGPGSYVWYQYLDRQLPQQTVGNLVLKVFLNQVVLGPCVIAVALAWNNLWLRKLSELPKKYQKDFLPTLFYGFRFWIPVSALNFWVVPLQGRVAFMSLGSIFWNYVLSSTMSK
ncbi:SYM1-like protein [Drosera capensis]